MAVVPAALLRSLPLLWATAPERSWVRNGLDQYLQHMVRATSGQLLWHIVGTIAKTSLHSSARCPLRRHDNGYSFNSHKDSDYIDRRDLQRSLASFQTVNLTAQRPRVQLSRPKSQKAAVTVISVRTAFLSRVHFATCCLNCCSLILFTCQI